MESQQADGMFIGALDDFAKSLGLDEMQTMRLKLLATKAENESVKAVIKMKAEEHHTIDISTYGGGYARVTFPKEILEHYTTRQLSFDVRLISDKAQLRGYLAGGMLDNIRQPIIIMIPKEPEDEGGR